MGYTYNNTRYNYINSRPKNNWRKLRHDYSKTNDKEEWYDVNNNNEVI